MYGRGLPALGVLAILMLLLTPQLKTETRFNCHSERSQESAFSSLLRELCALRALCAKFFLLNSWL